MIKVLSIIPTLNTAGAEKIVTDLNIAIDKSRFNAEVLTLYAKNDSAFQQDLEANNVKVTGLDKKLGLDISMFFKLKKHILITKPDVIHAHLNTLAYLVLLPRKYKKRIVYTLHSLAQHEAVGMHLMVQKKMYSTTNFVAISKLVQDSAEQVYGSKCMLINNGIMTAKYKCDRDYSNKINKIVTVGRLSVVKNHMLLLDAISQATDKSTVLNIYGQGDTKVDLERQIIELGLSDRVVLKGITADVAEVLRGSDMFILPSIYEGFGLVVAEAMASGLPVISTINGGAENMIENGVDGLLVANNCLPDLVSAINIMTSDRELSKKLGQNAMKKAAEFDIIKMAESYQSLFTEVYARATATKKTSHTR